MSTLTPPAGRPHPVMHRRVWTWTDVHGARHQTLWNPSSGAFHDWIEATPGRWTCSSRSPEEAETVAEAEAAVAAYVASF